MLFPVFVVPYRILAESWEFVMRVLVVDVLSAAKLLGVTRSALYRRMREGNLPSIRFGWRVYLTVDRVAKELGMSRDDLMEALERQGLSVLEMEV